MIEVKRNEVNVYSEMNDFINVTFIINGDDKEVLKASKALECAVENWFDDKDAEGMCYGDYFELLLNRAGVKDFETVYNYKEKNEDGKELKQVLLNKYFKNVLNEYFGYKKEKPGMKLMVEIYQKKEIDLGFHNVSDAKRELDNGFKDYKKVYEGIIDYIEPKELDVLPTNPENNIHFPTAECVFNTFQHGISENIPKEYKGRSLSSGDIIVIQRDNDFSKSCYYCMSIGFYRFNAIKIRNFFDMFMFKGHPKNPFQE